MTPASPEALVHLRALLELVELDRQLRVFQAVDGTLRDDLPARGEVEMLARQRAGLVERLPRALLGAYTTAARSGRHPALAEVRDGYCVACHLRVPPGLELRLQQQPEPATCPHCCRLVYHRHWVARPGG